MSLRLPALSLLFLLGAVSSVQESAAATSVMIPAVDYPLARWAPAATTNYTVANRQNDYPIDYIVIHDIEGSYSSAITAFQNPTRHASAHYVISYAGHITQMVAEKDIAWHAGNWDYNTRAIGIEHEGFAYTPHLYTYAEYKASAHLAASICSRWGVPMNRHHVIGHYQVPDPNHPGLFGGAEHHTDPGPYWNWSYYMSLAQTYGRLLPSPPHMVLQPTAFSGDGTATVSWPAAHTCRTVIASYTVVARDASGVEPDRQTTVLGSITTASFTGLTNGVSYSFIVTAHNSFGASSSTSNTVTPGPPCATANLSASPAAPRPVGVTIKITATSTGCANPQYEFFVQDSTGKWVVKQPFGGNTFNWDTYGYSAGPHLIRVWANHGTGNPNMAELFTDLTYSLNPFSMSDWQAAYDMSNAPTAWAAGQSQSFPVTITNTGTVTWPSTGFGKVDFDLHFTSLAGGSAKEVYWLNSKAFALPADLAPGASVTLNVTWTAPAKTGAMVLEAEMIKEHEFWFQQWSPVNVSVAAAVWSAGYDLSGVPATWMKGQAQTITVTVTNTGNTTWPSTSYYKVDLDFHFTTRTGGSSKTAYWLTSKAYSLPADLAPGNSVTLTVSVTAPATGGSMYLEAEMIKEHQFWFQQVASIPVAVN
jgi:N-acetyl-anhydromuramyl-L-alanine amidase AmpD